MNGGRNYNGPKVGIAALEKLGYMLESPRHLMVREASQQATRDKQHVKIQSVGTISRKGPAAKLWRGILRDYTPNAANQW